MVQKEGGLRAIAEEGHVVSIKKAAFNLGTNKSQIIPVPDGIGNASTFPGFCNTHDTMFRPAEEKPVTLGPEVAFLLSYRAIVYEMFMKEAALRSVEVRRQVEDRGQPFAEQACIQAHLYQLKWGVELGLKDVTRSKSDYDAAYHASHAGFNFCAVEFDPVLPVVSSGAFGLDFDLFGEPLQSLAGVSASLDPLAVNLTVLNGQSVLLLGWIKSGGASEKFAKSFIRLPASENAGTAVRLAMEYIEITFCRPSWWNGLPKEDRDAAVVASLFSAGPAPISQRGTDGRCIDGKTFASASVSRELSSLNPQGTARP